jgi:SOS response associated peptidase (SRAP)
MAGLWSDAPGPATGEVADSYTLVIGEANAAMRVHDRMPVVLPNAAAREWPEPGPPRPGPLAPYLAEGMAGWWVGEDAKNAGFHRRRRASRSRPSQSVARPTGLRRNGTSCATSGIPTGSIPIPTTGRNQSAPPRMDSSPTGDLPPDDGDVMLFGLPDRSRRR